MQRFRRPLALIVLREMLRAGTGDGLRQKAFPTMAGGVSIG